MDLHAATRLHHSIRHLDDDEWLTMLVASLDDSPAAAQLPRWPSAEAVRGSLYARAADPKAIERASAFARHLKLILGAHGRDLTTATPVLDIGCGWGRVYRVLMKDVSPQDLYGVDVDPALIAACRTALPADRFELVRPGEPLPYPDATFEVAFANSVLSHLTAEEHVAAVAGWGRVLRPGGLLVASVMQGKKINTHARQDERGILTAGPFRNIEDFPALRRTFDEEGFAWVSTKRRGEFAGYGLAFVDDSWLRDHWPADLEFLGVHDSPAYNQPLAVARRRSDDVPAAEQQGASWTSG